MRERLTRNAPGLAAIALGSTAAGAGQALFNGRSVTLDFHTNRFWVD